MRIRTDEIDLYNDPRDVPVSLTLEEIELIMARFEALTMGDISEEEIGLYVELRRTRKAVLETLSELNDPWGELK